ncbi:hypothetical protein J6590_016225 [Homalodisca vitripennis]|nr:hypothetical protein J6590_016225 [Homalodisca vitripennis]
MHLMYGLAKLSFVCKHKFPNRNLSNGKTFGDWDICTFDARVGRRYTTRTLDVQERVLEAAEQNPSVNTRNRVSSERRWPHVRLTDFENPTIASIPHTKSPSSSSD